DCLRVERRTAQQCRDLNPEIPLIPRCDRQPCSHCIERWNVPCPKLGRHETGEPVCAFRREMDMLPEQLIAGKPEASFRIHQPSLFAHRSLADDLVDLRVGPKSECVEVPG